MIEQDVRYMLHDYVEKGSLASLSRTTTQIGRADNADKASSHAEMIGISLTSGLKAIDRSFSG